jgi:molybdenum cofactor cytidylyltransferase
VSQVEGIILAAGSGSRFGGRKLLAPWRGGVLLDGALAAALAAPLRDVVVVTGADADLVGAAVAGRARLIHAADHAEGMAASLRAGISALPDDAAGAVVFLADMPLVPTGVVGRLVQALQDGAAAAAPFRAGRRGNPVAVSAALFPDVLALTGDQGARGILDRLGGRLVGIDTDDDGVLLDVDHPEDVPY